MNLLQFSFASFGIGALTFIVIWLLASVKNTNLKWYWGFVVIFSVLSMLAGLATGLMCLIWWAAS